MVTALAILFAVLNGVIRCQELVVGFSLKWQVFSHHRLTEKAGFYNNLKTMVNRVCKSVAFLLHHLPSTFDLTEFGLAMFGSAKVCREHDIADGDEGEGRQMKRILLISAVVLFGGFIGAAGAATITFEEITNNTGGHGEISGTEWQSLGIQFEAISGGTLNIGNSASGFGNGLGVDRSGRNNDFRGDLRLVCSGFSDLAFDVYNPALVNLRAVAYDSVGGDELASLYFNDLPGTGTFRTFDFSGYTVGSVEIRDATGPYVIDNVEFTSVPVPSALWLLGSGFVGLVGLRKRMKK